MQEIIFATNNQHKIDEIRSVIDGHFKILTLHEAGLDIEIEEPHDSLQENAWEKATVIYRLTHKNCFSEDTGLEVADLNGEPGVKSARYAEGEDYKDNIEKLLSKLGNFSKPRAQFRTIICLMLDNHTYYFEGICKGTITAERRGSLGFGYDSVFIPEGSSKTFAEMELKEKNLYSHRKKAVNKLIEFLMHYHAPNQD